MVLYVDVDVDDQVSSPAFPRHFIYMVTPGLFTSPHVRTRDSGVSAGAQLRCQLRETGCCVNQMMFIIAFR
ncbi:hypothetical protein EYC80_000684 [Monilinia laxa]|uniref:Uncharacterized protein n=1 Tax=Monilinia laxa TaxID=61186 RepID=A0A5N6KBM4_MONLA|nr:hypothetical protein EYC80_000684 [Monilinia laxa]